MPMPLLASLADELARAEFGDARLTRRLGKIIVAIGLAPSEGLPKAMRTTAALEATYRFMSNPKVTPERILEPHFEATCERASEHEVVLAVHDTTELGLGGQSRAHVGRTNNSQPGFFAHVALAVTPTGAPIGVIGTHTWARTEPASTKAERKTHRWISRTEKESDRWAALTTEVEARVAGRAVVVHVMDREGDQYRLYDEIIALNGLFVIRANQTRLVVSEEQGVEILKQAVERAPVFLQREVQLSRRRRKYTNVHNNLPRDARLAALSVSAMPVLLKRSHGSTNRSTAPTLQANVVRVVEVDPPAGEEKVEWLLVTNLPVDSAEDVERIVDYYRVRWTIEEFFKVLKTGCAYEKLQLESLAAHDNALAVILPIAWQMLALRSLARADENAPASRVLSASQLYVLKTNPWVKLPPRPSARQALRAIAILGGHIKNNGEPGWLVLYRGFRDLMLLAAGVRLTM